MDPNLKVIVATLVTSSIAIGISSGVSVYEAEVIEGEREVEELEAAMLTKLEDTIYTRSMKLNALLAAIIMFGTPLFSCTIAALPFALALYGLMQSDIAAWTSIALALVTLLTVGAYMGRDSKGNPLLKGVRMALFGTAAFLLGNWLQALI